MSRSVVSGSLVCLALVASAGFCALRASSHSKEAAFLMLRAEAQAEAFAETLDPQDAQMQLRTFAARRVDMEKSGFYRQLTVFFGVAAVLTAFITYMLLLYSRLRIQLAEASEGELVAVPAVARSGK